MSNNNIEKNNDDYDDDYDDDIKIHLDKIRKLYSNEINYTVLLTNTSHKLRLELEKEISYDTPKLIVNNLLNSSSPIVSTNNLIYINSLLVNNIINVNIISNNFDNMDDTIEENVEYNKYNEFTRFISSFNFWLDGFKNKKNEFQQNIFIERINELDIESKNAINYLLTNHKYLFPILCN